MSDTAIRSIGSIRSIGKSVPKILRKSLRTNCMLRKFCGAIAAYVSTDKHWENHCEYTAIEHTAKKAYIKKNIIKFFAVSKLYPITGIT